MGGAAGGLTGTGTVEIKVLDINDNIPTLEQSEVRNMAYTIHKHTQQSQFRKLNQDVRKRR